MEKTTIAVKRIGEFNVIENKRSSYKMVAINCTINDKKAEMTIEETFKYGDNTKGAQLVNWKFISGDHVVDATAKVFTDFLTFTEITGMEVDTNDILFDAENLFAELKKKEKEEKQAQEKIARGKAYDENLLLTTIKPLLEANDHKVASTTTKEEFINGRDISLAVDSIITVHYDYSGYLVAANDSYGDNRIEKKTRSAKTVKIISIIEEAIKAENYRRERIRENKKALAGAKENLESILGIVMVEKKEYHSNPNGPRGRSSGYETSYFVDAQSEGGIYNAGLRFVESSVGRLVDGKTTYVKGFSITNLPCITDPAKLRKIYDLLNE